MLILIAHVGDLFGIVFLDFCRSLKFASISICVLVIRVLHAHNRHKEISGIAHFRADVVNCLEVVTSFACLIVVNNLAIGK